MKTDPSGLGIQRVDVFATFGQFPWIVVLLAAAVLGASGCGYLLVNGPPENHEQLNYFSCTESDAGPVLDAVWAGLNAAGAVAIALDPDEYEYNYDVSSTAGILVGAGWTIFSGGAAMAGFQKTRNCREAKRALANRQMQGSVEDTARTPDWEMQR